jgi:phosphonate transport system substrate-binding protein
MKLFNNTKLKMKSPRSRSLKTKLIVSSIVVILLKNFTYLEDYKMENLQKVLGFSLVLILGLMSLTVVACQSAAGAKTVEDLPTPMPTPSRAETLILADLNEDVEESVEDFQPMADYLAANLGESGILEGKVVVAPDLETMTELLKNGEVDLYFDSAYAATNVYNEAGAVPLLRRWKDGIKEYYAVIVVRQDSGVGSLDDLKGQTIAFEEADSTSGYLIPRGYLLQQGYELVETSDSIPVADDQIGYVFAGSEENVLAWLLQGDVTASAFNVLDYEELPAEERAELMVIAQGNPVPRHVALASPKMDEKLRQQLTELLLAVHQTEEGQAVLETFEETSQFDEFPQGAEAAMAELAELFAGQE